VNDPARSVPTVSDELAARLLCCFRALALGFSGSDDYANGCVRAIGAPIRPARVRPSLSKRRAPRRAALVLDMPPAALSLFRLKDLNNEAARAVQLRAIAPTQSLQSIPAPSTASAPSAITQAMYVTASHA
jgi:hypothetical protein